MTGRARRFTGIGASPGVAIGRVYLLDHRKVRVPRYHIQADQISYETERLQKAIQDSVAQLEVIRSRFEGHTQGREHHAILEAHVMMLRDRALLDDSLALIKGDLINAEWAITRVITRVRGVFDRVANAYFRERMGDFNFVSERILRNLSGQSADVERLSSIPDGTIVVAHDLSPADTAELLRHRITAFVTEVGGKTSHTSIIARSLEVPAVVGAHGILDAAGSGDVIVVDGLDGSVVLRPSKAQLERGRQRAQTYQRSNIELLEARLLPAKTIDGAHVTVAGNIEMPGEVATVLSRGGEAIGLYRTEFVFVGRTTLPTEEEHYRIYCQLFDELSDKPVTVRTLDLGGEKIFGATEQQERERDPDRIMEIEPNPALGLRAIRYCLHHPDLFRAQIAGLLRAATCGDLRIMLPLISGLSELRQAKELIAEVAHRLQREGKPHRTDVPIGIMMEVPSSVLIADTLAKECDFFAVGTNDLLQYLLAIDRANERVAYLYEPWHPAVLRTLHMVMQAAKTAKIPVSVCGEMAGDVEHTPLLVGFGFDQLSMNAGSIPKIKRAINGLRRSDCEELVQAVLDCRLPGDVAAMMAAFAKEKIG